MAQGSRQIQSQAQQQVQTLSPQQILVVKLLGLGRGARRYRCDKESASGDSPRDRDRGGRLNAQSR